MKSKFIPILVAIASTAVIAEDNVDWSTSSMSPINNKTIRVFDLEYAPTPNTSYNVNFIFNEAALTFEVDPASLSAVDKTKYSAADPVRGGLLYDKWWNVNGAAEPTGNHALYPATGGQTGSTTWRCKECHGWDYKGKDGAYAEGSHFTGIKGIYDARNKTVGELYSAVASKNLSLSEQDIMDLVKFMKESLIEMDKYIIFSGTQRKSVTGDTATGSTLYSGGLAGCSGCHGSDGSGVGEEISLGAVASDNPWETLHKIRYGQPGSSMTSTLQNGMTVEEMVDILTFSQTLPK